MIEKLKTVSEVAEILGVKPKRVYELKDKKQLPFVKLGDRQYRFSDQAIQAFINSGGNQDRSEVKDEHK